MITKIVIDENLSPGVAVALRAFLALGGSKGAPKVVHLRKDLKHGGVADPVWMKKLRPASQWLVITSDSGKAGTDTPLPAHARSHGICVLVLFRSLGRKLMIERLRSILVMWPDIDRDIIRKDVRGEWRLVSVSGRAFQLRPCNLRDQQSYLAFMYKGAASKEVKDQKNERG